MDLTNAFNDDEAKCETELRMVTEKHERKVVFRPGQQYAQASRVEKIQAAMLGGYIPCPGLGGDYSCSQLLRSINSECVTRCNACGTMACVACGANATPFLSFAVHQTLRHSATCPQINLYEEQDMSAEYAQRHALEVVREEGEWSRALMIELEMSGQLSAVVLWNVVRSYLTSPGMWATIFLN